jgi:hypothetical protein
MNDSQATRGLPAGAPTGWMSWLDRYIDPATTLGEILFGLIMTLTFTLAAGVVMQEEGREGARELLIAVLGCNIAWGIIDAALFLASTLFERGERRVVGQRLRAATDAGSVTLLADRFDELLDGVLSTEERAAMYRRITAKVRATGPVNTGLSGKDWVAALIVCIAVIVSTFPAALPFWFIDDPWMALRVSNAILLALLFWCGWSWARYTPAKPWKVGLAYLVGGLVLVLIAIPLGG